MGTPSQVEKSQPPEKPGSILIVDDEPLIVDSVREQLEFAGYLTTCAASGQQAMEILKTCAQRRDHAFDLVLLDRSIPEFDGLEICRWIKEHPQLNHTPVIILTASTSADDKVEGFSTGADDYVTKPYSPKELLARISVLIRAHRMEQELFQRNRQLATLNHIITTITSSIKMDDVLTATLQGIREILDVEAGSLLLLDQSQNYLVFRKAIGRDREWSISKKVKLGQGLAGHAAQSRTPLLVNDVQNDPRFYPGIDDYTGFTTRSALAVPLTVKDKLIGVMEAINKLDGPFTPDDLELFLSMAASVAIALENARLFEDIRTAYEQVEANRQKLQETASTLRALFDGITDGLYIVNREWRIAAINQSQAKQVAAEPDTLIDRICYQALFGRDAPCPGCQVAATFAAGRRGQWVDRIRASSGLLTEWELSTYPIFDNKREIIQAIISRREVTEQRRLEASLAQAEKLAAVGQLAAGVAHEINNPLTAIIANAQFLMEDLSPAEDTFQSAELISRAGERAARVVRRLLDFARQEESIRQKVDVNASLQEALTLMEHQFSTANIHVLAQFDRKLPPIFASADHIQSIWLNLLVNARDALYNFAGERKIKVISSRKDDQVQISISDTGPGIAADQLPHVFHPFYTTKAPGKGTGLGLSTSFRTAQQHGGRIDVISQVGQGTVFVVSLPINPESTH